MRWDLKKTQRIIFYVLVFCLPLQVRHIFFRGQFSEWTSFYFYATDILVLGFIALSFFSAKLKGFRPDKADLALAGFLLFSGLSIFFALDINLSVYSFLKLTEMAAFFFCLKYFLRGWSLARVFQILAASAALQGIVAWFQFLQQKSLGLSFLHESPIGPDLAGVAKLVVDGQKIIRAYGLMPHPNLLAAILTAALFGLVFLFLFSDPKKLWPKIAFAFALILLASALFLTFSRGVLAVFYLFLSGWLIYLWFLKERKKVLTIAISLLIVNIFLLFVFWPFVVSRFDVSSLADSQAVNLRSFYNQVAWSFMIQNPALGVGGGNFVTALSQHADNLADWIWQPVHNIYLLVGSQAGFLGLLAFLVFLFFTIKSAWLHRSELGGGCLLFLTGSLLAFGLFDHFLWDLQQGQLLFWMFLGFLAGNFKTVDD